MCGGGQREVVALGEQVRGGVRKVEMGGGRRGSGCSRAVYRRSGGSQRRNADTGVQA